MKANDYQIWTEETAIYPKEESLSYILLGLNGEAGELANSYKKCIRDDAGILSDSRRENLIAEMGDCVWYLARLAQELGTTLEDVMQMNHDKLMDRKLRNKLQGSGDNR